MDELGFICVLSFLCCYVKGKVWWCVYVSEERCGGDVVEVVGGEDGREEGGVFLGCCFDGVVEEGFEGEVEGLVEVGGCCYCGGLGGVYGVNKEEWWVRLIKICFYGKC